MFGVLEVDTDCEEQDRADQVRKAQHALDFPVLPSGSPKPVPHPMCYKPTKTVASAPEEAPTNSHPENTDWWGDGTNEDMDFEAELVW